MSVAANNVSRFTLFTLERHHRDMFSRLLDQEVAYFDANRTGDLINRLSADAHVVQKSLTNNISAFLRSSFMVWGLGCVGFGAGSWVAGFEVCGVAMLRAFVNDDVAPKCKHSMIL